MHHLIPRHVRQWRAANMARRQFLENNLHHTRGETGTLLFISEAEHYAEIIVDRGISRHIDNATWQRLIDDLIRHIKQGKTKEGMLECIRGMGSILADVAPATSKRDELPNHLIILE